MGSVNDNLKPVFANYLYPGIIIFIFLLLLFLIFRATYKWKDRDQSRKITGALLPPLTLVFVLTLISNAPEPFWPFFFSTGVILPLIIGALLGIAIPEITRRRQKLESQIEAAFYILILSMMGSFIVYSATQTRLGILYYGQFGFILAAGLSIFFLGLPAPGNRGVATVGSAATSGAIQDSIKKVEKDFDTALAGMKDTLEKSFLSKIEGAKQGISELQRENSQIKSSISDIKFMIEGSAREIEDLKRELNQSIDEMKSLKEKAALPR